LTTSRLLLLCSVVTVSWANARADVTAAISSLGFRPVIPIVENIQLGGLLLPGQEALGTTGEEAVRDLLKVGSEKISRGLFSTPVEIGEWATLFPGTAATRDGCPVTSSATLLGWESHELATLQDARGLNVQLASRLAVQPDSLNGHVVVTSVLLPKMQIFGCDNPTAAKRLESRLGQSVMGYRGATEIESAHAIGTSKRLTVLEIFELDDIAKDRALVVKGIQADPAGLLGFADPIRLAGKAPNTAEDERFLWIGRTPLDNERRMATGRFYFRVKPTDGSAPVTFFRDLTISDSGKVLKLP
jgi:hypothetical protein